MNKLVMIVILSVATGVGIGYLIFSRSETVTNESSEQTAMTAQMSPNAMHEEIEVDATLPAPTVLLEATEDTKDGYNLQITTTNFTFTPEKAGNGRESGEGHAHIYVNGKKLGRVYGEWFYLSSANLVDGENVVEVTLNANDHSDWLINGDHISSSVTVTK